MNTFNDIDNFIDMSTFNPEFHILIKIKSKKWLDENAFLIYNEYEDEEDNLDSQASNLEYWFSEKEYKKSCNSYNNFEFCCEKIDAGIIRIYPIDSYERAKWYIEEAMTKKEYPQYFV